MTEPNFVAEAKRLCVEFEKKLPLSFVPPADAQFLTPSGRSIFSKMPSKIISVVGSLGYRAKDFGELSYELLERKKIVPAIVLARALMETTALVYLTHKKMIEAINSEKIIELDDFLVKCMSGNRIKPDDPDSPNILTAIQHLDKETGCEGYIDFYNTFCEFTHPNSLGTFYAYTEFNAEVYTLSFGENKGLTDANSVAFGVVFALEVLIEFYDRILAIIPSITSLSVKLFDQSKAI